MDECPWCVGDGPDLPDTADLCDMHCAEYLGTSVALLQVERASLRSELLDQTGTVRL